MRACQTAPALFQHHAIRMISGTGGLERVSAVLQSRRCCLRDSRSRSWSLCTRLPAREDHADRTLQCHSQWSCCLLDKAWTESREHASEQPQILSRWSTFVMQLCLCCDLTSMEGVESGCVGRAVRMHVWESGDGWLRVIFVSVC